jgi:hypothetical protein
MFCQRCGKQLPDGVIECDTCPSFSSDNAGKFVHIEGEANAGTAQDSKLLGVGIEHLHAHHSPITIIEATNRNTTDVPGPSQEEQQAALTRYFEYLHKQCGFLSPRGVPQNVSMIPLRLDEIYVPLTTIRERVQDPRTQLSGLSRTDIPTSPPKQEDSSIPHKQPIAPQEKMDLPRVVIESDGAVLLGEPGAGKTTLTNHLAILFAHAYQHNRDIVQDRDGNQYGEARLPILIRLADYAEDLRINPHRSLSEFLAIPCGQTEDKRRTLASVFEHALDEGNALVILNGLDEVADEATHVKIARRIDDFAVHLKAGNRIIVTSRIAGYHKARLGSAFHQYTILPFK